MESISTKGTVVDFSPRFSMTGVSGIFPANSAAYLKTPDLKLGTAAPPAIAAGAADGAAPAPADKMFAISYTMQTGPTRYAPMQPVPPTKITAKGKPTPLHPSSVLTGIATTFLKVPDIKTTITQSQTFSVSSRENPVRTSISLDDGMGANLYRLHLRRMRPRRMTWPSS